jgi:hypothetical protein
VTTAKEGDGLVDVGHRATTRTLPRLQLAQARCGLALADAGRCKTRRDLSRQRGSGLHGNSGAAVWHETMLRALQHCRCTGQQKATLRDEKEVENPDMVEAGSGVALRHVHEARRHSREWRTSRLLIVPR